MQLKIACLIFILITSEVNVLGQSNPDSSTQAIPPIMNTFINPGKDSVILSIQELDEITKCFKQDENYWKDILPLLISLAAVVISGWSVYSSRKQINAQIRNAEDQLRSQETQSQEQLRVAREQIHETSKMTLAQVRANNISQARINWVQDLRTSLSAFIGEVAIAGFHFDQVKKTAETNLTEAKDHISKLTDRVKAIREYAFKVKLFLSNNPKEVDHIQLEKLIDEFMIASTTGKKDGTDLNKLAHDILKVSKKILKEAWEQAKNESSI
jgi:hypothetical protein